MKVNPVGAVAGALILLLPFLGPWWHASLGEAAVVELSPFGYRVCVLGELLHSTLASYLLLGAKVSVILGGIFLLLGSLFPGRWWSRPLVRFGVMKVFWMVISLVVFLVVASFVANFLLRSIRPEDVTLDLSLPLLTGSSELRLSGGNMSASMPVDLHFTGVFWMAVVVAGFGLAARITAGRFQGALPAKPAKPNK
ncbi:MAG: hypothetical protein QXW77_02630 [Candidatus Hadarchaeales archaeon]